MTAHRRKSAARPNEQLSIGERWKLGWITAIGPVVIRLLGATWRVSMPRAAVVDDVHAQGRRFIYAFWHCHILPLGFTHRGSGVAVLSSWHRDGEISTRLMEALGFVVERGSTSRGSVRGLIRMIRQLREGRDLAVTPDGPKGPARVAQTGALFLALKATSPIVPLGVGVSACRRLSNWDRFVIPYPFARVVILHGVPYEVDAGTDLKEAASDLTRRIERLCEQAQAVADGRPYQAVGRDPGAGEGAPS